MSDSVPETPAPQSLIVNAVLDVAGRSTLPFTEARAHRDAGTAFWYNDLVDSSTPGREVIRQYLVTAEALTRHELGRWTLRDGLCAPEGGADELMMPDFASKWIRLEGLGVAVMPTVDLHTHAERKGWSWTTEEITEGLAAVADDLAAIGAEPVPAYVLGHGADPEQDERPQSTVVGTVSRDDSGVVRWEGELPTGYAGAPVFLGIPLGDEQFKLVCLGLVLPGESPYQVVTFDRIRPAVHALAPTSPRRWWQRRRG